METNVFKLQSGYKKHEVMSFRNPTTTKEMVEYCDSHQHIWLRDCKGNARQVKVNGRVRTWKRDAERIEVPFKYGLYEYGILTARDIVDVLIPAEDSAL